MTADRDLVSSLLHDPSFQDWVTGVASDQEDRAWSAWIDGADTDPFTATHSAAPNPAEATAAERADAVAAASSVIRRVSFQDPPVSSDEVDAAWREVQNRRSDPNDRPSRPDRETDGPDDRAPSARPPRKRRRHRTRKGLRVGLSAAVVAALALSLWMFQTTESQPVVLTTNAGEQATLTLPDDSRIVLNAHSRLEYNPRAFENGDRQVTIDGEALFTIKKRPSADDPSFRVETPDGTVRVLGTTFSVEHRDRATRVVLEEGRVAVDTRVGRPDTRRDTTFDMVPGDLVTFDADSGEIAQRNVNPQVYTSWASGVLVFDDTPLPEIVERIEATYDVTVVVENPGVLERQVSGSVENDLSVLIEGLSQILERPIDRRGDRIVIR